MNKEMVNELRVLVKEMLRDLSLSLNDLEDFTEIKEDLKSDKWDVIVKLTDRFLTSSSLTGKMLEQIYIIMALDSKSECVRGLVEKRLSEEKYEVLVKYARYCPYPNTRWQVIDSLVSIGYDYAASYLEKFLTDEDAYIVRKALLSLNEINGELAQNYAKKLIFHNDEELRSAAKEVLSQTS